MLRRDGGAACDLLYPVRAEYTPLLFTLSSPFYRDSIFPGQDVKAIAGALTVNLAADKLAKAVVDLEFSGQKARATARDGRYYFSLPITGPLADGDYKLTAKVTSGGSVLVEGALVIRKLPPTSAS